jgi:2-phosphosulfolactate phosphatase
MNRAMGIRQAGYSVRCEWGERGTDALACESDVVILVDVLSFTTCVDVATARGASVFPYRWKDYSSVQFAARVGAELARSRRAGGLSLSPASLMGIAARTKLVLPSPNGATLSLMTGDTPTFAGCLRNAAAVAREASRVGERITVIAAGERWADGSLRPALEDWLGAGAIIEHLEGALSPEARAARDAYRAALPDVATELHACHSGQELIGMGYEQDVRLASEIDASPSAPRLVDAAYVNTASPDTIAEAQIRPD